MPGRRNADANTYGYGDSDSNHDTNIANAYSYCNSYGYTACESDADTLGDQASANAKAAAHAVPTADALGDNRLKS